MEVAKQFGLTVDEELAAGRNIEELVYPFGSILTRSKLPSTDTTVPVTLLASDTCLAPVVFCVVLVCASMPAVMLKTAKAAKMMRRTVMVPLPCFVMVSLPVSRLPTVSFDRAWERVANVA